MVLGRAAPGADLSAAQRRKSARVGAREQLGPGILVEALGLSGPPAAVERNTPDEDPPAGWARRLPASGQGQEVMPCPGSTVGGRGNVSGPPTRPSGPPPISCRPRIRRQTIRGHHGGVVNS